MRFPRELKVPGSSLGAVVAVYAVGVAFAVMVAGYGAHRVATALTAEFSTSQPAGRAVLAQAPKATVAVAPGVVPGGSEPTVVSEGAMTVTQGWGGFSSRSYRNPGSQFGSSSRSQRGFFESPFGDDDEWEDRSRATYRTLCVRLCDGYYFPISFSVTTDRFERDRQVCENSCGAQARLFVYRNPGGQIEDMQDLRGQPYRKLKTAFLYRTEYVADCKCQPHPWEPQALDRHRGYALGAAKQRGDKEAIARLTALMTKNVQQEKRATKTAALTSGATSDHRVMPGLPVGLPQSITEAEQLRLGTEARRRNRVLPESRRPLSYPNRSTWVQRTPWQIH